MANALLLCLLPGAIGAAYVWLNGRMEERKERNLLMLREVSELQQQIRAVNVQLSAAVRRDELRELADRVAPGLKPIPVGPRNGRLIVLPPPDEDGGETAAETSTSTLTVARQ